MEKLDKTTNPIDLIEDKQSILLHEGNIKLLAHGLPSVYGKCRIKIDLLPSPNIHCYGYFNNNSDIIEMFTTNCDYEILVDELHFNGLQILAKSNFTQDKNYFEFKWVLRKEPFIFTGNELTPMKTVEFKLFNFVDTFNGRRSIERQGNTSRSIEYIDLSYEDWNIEIKSLFSTKETFNSLKNNGGTMLTHIGKIQRINNNVFLAEEAQNILKTLELFLSFAKGGECFPVCPEGIDKFNNKVWGYWNAPYGSWRTLLSWFDIQNPKQISIFYPLFMNKIKTSGWSDVFNAAIYWYVKANDSSRGIDAGIILAQAALELLSYELIVNDKKLLTEIEFKDQRTYHTSCKLKKMFDVLNAPVNIPQETPTLLSLASKFNWQGAPHALTEIRNFLVHPVSKYKGVFTGNVIFEAWNLCLWYLEMSILAICGYNGKYGNRLKYKRWAGEVENVPWVH